MTAFQHGRLIKSPLGAQQQDTMRDDVISRVGKLYLNIFTGQSFSLNISGGETANPRTVGPKDDFHLNEYYSFINLPPAYFTLKTQGHVFLLISLFSLMLPVFLPLNFCLHCLRNFLS